ncbi:beta-ketoacyl synthase N-terminal-like domain-containing protein [Henriciella sp.]|uniref:beta-ketoacyl synthase N-terminal-like domain-containing protein n=1 Tax=Henriciella sp. TaxID=1968823 RepID=UPI00262BE7F0|nr:beta-ketoacyl synthase N-terminal-like domain-containing protein [Henriciella sp.]
MGKPRFEPIAIIGRGCVLPGALSPAALWQAILEDRDLLASAPQGKWGVTDTEQAQMGYRGGFVTDFEDVFDPSAHKLGDIDAARLDPLFQWLLHAGRAAWLEAGAPKVKARKLGVITGNLGYPSRALCDYASDVWQSGASTIDPANRFNTGGPARLLAQALKARGPAFALDAACASSLYAVKLACDRLQDGSLDVAIAAAVNGADNLILHQGFSALNALSPTGQSRPFVQGADGLVPAEGAAALVLKRLADCTEDDTVHGVIRGIGLSNDGRRKSLLAPDEGGQAEAMAAAWKVSGLDPACDIGLLEAHATGTATGDRVELLATAAHFTGKSPLPIGSLKGNLGHLITAAGIASLIKMSFALNEGIIPPTRLEGEALEGFDGVNLTPARKSPWPEDRPRIAAVSNFGFGGNNAHLILAADNGKRPKARKQSRSRPQAAICATGLSLGPDRGVAAVLQRLSRPPKTARGPMQETAASPKPLRTPPSELASAQGQQLALYDAVDEALARFPLEDGARVSVFTGFACAPEAARWMLRARIAERLGLSPEVAETDALRNNISPPLKPGDVLGAMPNVSANRLNVRGDWRAQGFAVMEEEASGLRALELAMRALEAGEIDAAIVASADLSADPVHETATGTPGGDAAAAFILKRAKDATPPVTLKSLKLTGSLPDETLLERLYGVSHAAGGLARLAVETELASRGMALETAGITPVFTRKARTITVSGGRVKLKARPHPAPDLLRPAPHLETYAASTRSALLDALRKGQQACTGKHRLAIIATDETTLAARRAEAIAALVSGAVPQGEGLHYGKGKPAGELAFVFTGAAAAYSGMGQGLFAAFPELGPKLAAKFPAAPEVARLLAGDLAAAYDQLRATTLISQAQHMLLTDILGLKPAVAMGLSSGETNSLIAFGAWTDADGLMGTIGESGMYTDDLAGDFKTAQAAWKDNAPVSWETWRVQASESAIRSAMKDEPRCDLTILYSPTDGVIAGDARACQRVLKRLGGSAIRVPHDLVVHTPMMDPYEKTWRRLHTRKTKAPKGVRFYANAVNGPYRPDRKTVARMLTGQAVAEVNFPKTLMRAHKDGVRTFIEIGPRDTLTGAIRETLGDEVTALATDRFGQPALFDIATLAAAVFATGHDVKMERVKARLEATRANTIPFRRTGPGEITFPAHKPPPRLPSPLARRTLTPPRRPGLKPFTPPASKPPRGRKLPLAPGISWKPPGPAIETAVLERPATRPTPRPAARKPAPAPATIKGVTPLFWREPVGPNFTRQQIEHAAAGNISEVFGEAFTAQDKYVRQVRMPRPPMLLCDRIAGIDAEALVQGKGTIWTETDVTQDLWAVSDGRLRPGPLIEAGQADLALISWMGADMLNCSDRVYRLLGCELTFHETGLPRIGETVRFQISIKGHAELSGVRMFFFEYDCYADDRLILSVRNGQAGFFTDEELANSKGVLWDAEKDGAPTAEPRLDRTTPSQKTAFTSADVAAFRAGDTYRCFGAGFERAAPHTRPARLPAGRLALFDDVETFEPQGGPWGRGYLKACQHVPKDAWFYDGHFHEDPCMPGTLMAEAAVQTLEFTAAALGFTIERDSHVFEPAPGEAATFYCRGQVTPDADHDVTYEVFIDEIIDGEEPVVFASLLARSDGRKVFYCPRFGVRLRRQWPHMAKAKSVPHYVNDEGDVRGDEAAMIECGSGAPSNAFGSMYAPFDHRGAVPRLPQPPYHMVSRVLSVTGPSGQQAAGLTAIAEYDIPPDAWYFTDGGTGTMPFSVLTEVILQPCGWLASYSGFALSGETRFRNLDGAGRTARQIWPEDGTIRTRTTLTRASRVGPMTIVFFELEATLADGTPVVTLETSFGFFTKASLAAQAGLKASDAARAFIDAPADPPSEAETVLPVSTGRLALFDMIDRFEPEGGAAGLGRIRAQQFVDPYAWYFRAHFFSDPVQPGSLGLDMLVQLLARAGDLKGLAARFEQPHWEPVEPGEDLVWTYRGQVNPTAKQVTATIEIDGVEEQDEATIIRGTGSLWVDGLRIYEMRGVSIRFCTAPTPLLHRSHTTLRPQIPAWVGAHRPTHTLPALPLLSQAGMLLRQARAADFSGYPIELTGFSPRQWASVPDHGLRVETRVTPDGKARLRGRAESDPDAPWTILSSGQIATRTRAPASRLKPSDHGKPLPDPYETADLFHGPGLRPVTGIRRDSKGFEATVDLSLADCPGDAFDAVILDALVHGPPHETPEEWFDGVEDCAIYPVRIERLVICSDLPATGDLTIRGVPGQRDLLTGDLPVTIEAFLGSDLWARLDLIEKAYPKGPLSTLGALERKAFLKGESDAHPAPLSRTDGKLTRLSPADVIACDWLPGTVAEAWGCEGLTGSALVKAVAVKEHFACKWGIHPGKVQLDPPFVTGPGGRQRYDLSFDPASRTWCVTDDGFEEQ